MNINTNSGQAVGSMMKNWNPSAPLSVVSKGYELFVRNLTESNDFIVRTVLSLGESVSVVPRMGQGFDGSIVREMFLNSWFFLDFTLYKEGKITTISVVQTAKRTEEKIGVYPSVYIGRQRTKYTFSDFRNVAGNLGAEEFWNRLIGIVKPSWGLIMDNVLFMSESDRHVCSIRNGFKWPERYDVNDVGRMEEILAAEGCFIRDINEDDVYLRLNSYAGKDGVASNMIQTLSPDKKEKYLS